MIRNTGFVGLTTCVLVLAGCTPRIDSSSQDKYEQSLVSMTKGLSPNELTVLTEAVSIIQTHTSGISLLNQEANNRNKLSGMTREEVVNKAKLIVLDWFSTNRSYIDHYCKAEELASSVSFTIIGSKQRDDNPFVIDVSVVVKNQSANDIVVNWFLLDERPFIHKELNNFKVAGGTSRLLKGFTTRAIPFQITFASVDGIQIIPNTIDIPVGFSEFLEHVGLESRPCMYQTQISNSPPNNHPKQ